MNLPSISSSFIFDENNTGAVAIKVDAIKATFGSSFMEGISGPPPVANLACFSFVMMSL